MGYERTVGFAPRVSPINSAEIGLWSSLQRSIYEIVRTSLLL
jgi:hypothetical protein